MKIELNHKAESDYEMFFLKKPRAKEILEQMAEICVHAIENFYEDYQFVVVFATEQNAGELMHRLDVHKVLSEMLALAEAENETLFILFNAKSGIQRVSEHIFKHSKNHQ